jgi:hypothetical protein
MTSTITAVNVDPSAGSLAPSSMTEHTLQEFATLLQNGSLSGMPQLANPGALASELFSNLRGYFERAQSFERGFKRLQSHGATSDDGVQVALMSVPDELRTMGLHRGPARENLEPAGSDQEASPLNRMSADIDRALDLLMQSAELSIEEYILGIEVSQAVSSVNTLLKGQ